MLFVTLEGRLSTPMCVLSRSFTTLMTLAALALLAAGCVSTVLDVDSKAIQPIPAKLVGEMSRKAMSPSSPHPRAHLQGGERARGVEG